MVEQSLKRTKDTRKSLMYQVFAKPTRFSLCLLFISCASFFLRRKQQFYPHFDSLGVRSRLVQALKNEEDDALDGLPFKDIELSLFLPFTTLLTRGVKVVARPPGLCTVYSAGLSNDTDFEKDLERSGCSVHGFDCTLRSEDSLPQVANFHHWCLGESYTIGERYARGGSLFDFRTLSKTQHELGHKKLDILKLDIEGGEWELIQEAVLSLLVTPADIPMQLIFELHTEGANSAFVGSKIVAGKRRHSVNTLFLALYDKGFRVFHKAVNPWDRFCADFSLIHVSAIAALVTADKSSHFFAPPFLNWSPIECTAKEDNSRPHFLHGLRVAEVSGKLRMALYAQGIDVAVSDVIQNKLMPYCNKDLMDDLSQRPRGTAVLLDIGSNIGSCALWAASHGQHAIALEPMASNLDLIRISASLNGQKFASHGSLLIVIPVAAGATQSTSKLLLDPHNSGNNIVIENNAQTAAGAWANNPSRDESVCITTVDAIFLQLTEQPSSLPPFFLSALQSSDLLVKIDVQGHEVAVFEGMSKLLSIRRPLRIYMELWPPVVRAKGFNPVDIYDIAVKSNYGVYLPPYGSPPDTRVQRSTFATRNVFLAALDDHAAPYFDVLLVRL